MPCRDIDVPLSILVDLIHEESLRCCILELYIGPSPKKKIMLLFQICYFVYQYFPELSCFSFNENVILKI